MGKVLQLSFTWGGGGRGEECYKYKAVTLESWSET